MYTNSQKFQSGLFFTCFSTALTFADAEGRFAHITVDFYTQFELTEFTSCIRHIHWVILDNMDGIWVV